MGLFVLLYFNFNGVERQQWEKVYDESKKLLHRFPIELIRYKPEEKYGYKRGVFTTDLVANPGEDDEFWRVDGDKVSGRRAETFMLYKKEYERIKDIQLPGKDILWTEDKHIDYISANGYRLFDSKTQGYPYHLAMLAVGMLFESRFPTKALVTGDIDNWQAEIILKWFNQVQILNGPIMKPISLDAPRLWDRLHALYPDKKQLFKRFKSLFQGDNEEKLATILKKDDSGMSRAFFFEELNTWDTLSKVGAVQLITQWLNTTTDLETLIRCTCVIPEQEKKEGDTGIQGKFKLEDLLEVICHKFIQIPMAERTLLSLFSLKKERLHTINDLFAQTFMVMGGAPHDINLYISPEALFQIFARFEPDPEKRIHLREIIEKSEQKNREILEKIKTQIDEVMKQPASHEGPDKSLEPGAAAGEKIEAQKEEDMDQVLIDSAKSQQIIAQEPEKLAQSVGDSLRRFAERNKDALTEYLDSNDREYLLAKIVEISFEEGFALLEEAWADIDQEKNLSILKAILCLSLIHNNEMNFWRLRIFILQNKKLWPFIALDTPGKEIERETAGIH